MTRAMTLKNPSAKTSLFLIAFVGSVAASVLLAQDKDTHPDAQKVELPFGEAETSLTQPSAPVGDDRVMAEGVEDDSDDIPGVLKEFFAGERVGVEEEDDGETTSSEEDGEGLVDGGSEDRTTFLKKFVTLFHNQDEETDLEADDENYRRIKELERFAIERNFRKQRYTAAKKNLNDLITLKPYDPGYHFALGLVLRKEGRYEDALKKYQDVLDLGGPKPLVHLLIAEAYAVSAKKESAFEHIKQAAVGGRNVIHDIGNLSNIGEYRQDTDFIKLALSLEKYELISKKTQDPLTQAFPFRSGEVAIEADPAGETGPFLPEDQEKLLNDARKSYDRVLWFIKLEDEEKAIENYIQLRGYLEQVERVSIPKIKNDFRLLLARMESLEAQIEGIRLRFYYNQALAQLQLIKEAFHEAEYTRVKTLFEEVKKLAKEMERTNVRYSSVAERVVNAGEVWIRRTQVREDFNANRPMVQGIILAADAKKAIINDRIFKQGDRFDEFLVQKVENNRVTFRYKGEEIPLVFRRY